MRRSLLFCIATICFACNGVRAPPPFVLTVALPGKIQIAQGQSFNGYLAITDDWVFEPIEKVTEDGRIVPWLASRIDRRPDGSMRLQLKSGSVFSDGSAVTLEDLAEALRNNGLKARIEEGAVIAEAGTSGFLSDSLLAGVSLVKRQGSTPIGSGPFAVSEVDADHMTLQRRKPEPGRINQVRLNAYANSREAMARVLRGEANMLFQLEAREVELFEGVARLQIVRGPSPHAVVLAMNPRLGVAERRAVAASLPIEEISAAAFGDSCKPWPRRAPHAQMPADTILDVTTTTGDTELSKLGLAVRRALGPNGGEVDNLPFGNFIEQVMGGTYQLAPMTVLVWPTGTLASVLHSGSTQRGLLHYSNPRVDAAFDAGDWLRVLDALDEDPPLVFVCTRDRVAIMDSRIKNAKLGPWGLFETMPEWEVAEP